MTGRITCLVPFCQRTTARHDCSEWICGPHWRLVGAATKRRRRQVDRRLRRLLASWQSPIFQARLDRTGRVAKFADMLARARLASDALWARCKTEAIERAAGISA